MALRALLQLAALPNQWQSITSIASAQGLPQPMLEQLLLQLRRAGLVEARRGRYGGYRLGRPAREIPVAAVLEAVAGGAGLGSGVKAAAPQGRPDPNARASLEATAAAGATAVAQAKDIAQAKDVAQAKAAAKPGAGAKPEAVAEERVLAALERRLQRALERELRDLSLEELHYDLRSWQESLSNDGGLLLG